jgi:hypothetical protein
MVKKKSSKDKEVKTFNYSVELNGLLLINCLIALYFGPVGRLIKDLPFF